MKVNEITREIIGAAIEVHRELGPGKAELAYENAMARELFLRGLTHQVQKPVPVIYKGIKLECGYRLDLLVADTVVGEIKAVETVLPVHRAQTLTYLKLGGWKVALLLNFDVAVMKDGVQRLVFGYEEDNVCSASDLPLSISLGAGLSNVHLRSTKASGDARAEDVTREVMAGAIEVHRELGPGLLPSAYSECLCHELSLRRIPFERNRSLPLHYKGVALREPDQVPMLIDNRVVVMPLAAPDIRAVHEAQVLSQMRLGGWPLGLLVNFNTVLLSSGLRRLVLNKGSRLAGVRCLEKRSRVNWSAESP